MNTEKLTRIRNKCVELKATYQYEGIKGSPIAALDSTIAAIDGILATLQSLPIGHYATYPLKSTAESIEAAWPEELL